MKRSSEAPSSSSKHQPQRNSSNAAMRNSSRSQFNQLCSTLNSIIPPQQFHNSMDKLSQADQIEHATNYIVDLRERVENLRQRRDQLMVNQEGTSNTENLSSNDTTMMTNNSGLLPINIEVKEMGSILEVQLVVQRGERDFKLHEVIRVLEEEGAEVVNATFSTSENNVFHTLHARARSSRIGVETSRVQERLQELI